MSQFHVLTLREFSRNRITPRHFLQAGDDETIFHEALRGCCCLESYTVPATAENVIMVRTEDGSVGWVRESARNGGRFKSLPKTRASWLKVLELTEFKLSGQTAQPVAT